MPTGALPPPPVNDKPGSFTWLEWYRQLRNYVSTSGSVPWYIINFSGSNITDIALRDHNNLDGLQGGGAAERYHLTLQQEEQVINATQSVTTATATVTNATTIVVNYAGACTLTLPAAASYTGRTLNIKTITANTVASATANVSPLAGGAAATPILAATSGKWATLTIDGTSWVIMAAN